MDSEQQWGFTPSPRSSKKRELPETAANSEPKVVNNYLTEVVTNSFTVVINPQAVLLVVLLIVVAYALFRLNPGLRA